jgi:heme exporter protein A
MLHIPVRYLSEGQRKRVALSSLFLMQNRRLWILDEPFVNLDADAAAILRGQIALRQKSGWVTLITSHQDVIGLPTQDYTLGRA